MKDLDVFDKNKEKINKIIEDYKKDKIQMKTIHFIIPQTIINKMKIKKKINCLNIVKEIDKIRINNSHQDNLKLGIYYLLKGLNEKRKQK